MKPTFEPNGDGTNSPIPPQILIYPEAYDASEQQFAASLEEKRPRFVVEAPRDAVSASPLSEGAPSSPEQTVSSEATDSGPDPKTCDESDDSWRQELQARITSYRARNKPRPPRYPSLQLKFDSESAWSGGSAAGQDVDNVPPAQEEVVKQEPVSDHSSLLWAGASTHKAESARAGKIADFMWQPPLPAQDELAEAVLEKPAILETPEVLPPPPALGGILIETVEEQIHERRPGFDLPLQAASMCRRVLALAVDGLLVAMGVTLFAYIFFKNAVSLPPIHHMAVAFVAVGVFFWIGYQYLMLVHAGSTPGLRIAKLRLSRFDGRPVPRRLRRWRVLASVLAGLSLALGYAWSFFDEDRLCWHDRITHTYMAPAGPK